MLNALSELNSISLRFYDGYTPSYGYERPMEPSQDLAIDIRSLSFSYGSRTVLQDFTSQIPVGQVLGVLGANAAGKTTLMRLVTGLLVPQKGIIRILGIEVPKNDRTLIGYMPQKDALYPELSVQDNVDFFARMYGISDRDERRTAVSKALSVVQLEARQKDSVYRLSGGMRQRASLAVALVHSPPLLVLDEPTVGLDPELRSQFWEHFSLLAHQGTTLLLSSHTMDDANHCDRLLFVHDGRVVADGSPETLRASVDSPTATLEEAFLQFVRGQNNEC